MKKMILLALMALLAACGQTPTTDTPKPGEVELKSSSFEGTTKYAVSGKVRIVQVGQDKTLKLAADFSTDTAPDLHVWLVKDETSPATGHLDLGKLLSNRGAQSFEIPKASDIASFSHIYIWCESVSELFGKASLKTTPDPDPVDPTPMTIAEGNFSGDSVGDIEIVQTGSKRVIKLASNFAANGTDDVSLYLATDASGSNFIDLGKLAITGIQSFDIPDSLDLSSYTFVIVWCNTISEVIGTADLDKTPDPVNPTPTVIFQGTFSMDSRGDVQVVQTGTQRVVKLADNFRANGTNNVNIWLAKSAAGAEFIDLGDLALTGAQSFNIADSLDLAVYKYVIIWCADVSSVIGRAELQ